jgi:hypothetical protein
MAYFTSSFVKLHMKRIALLLVFGFGGFVAGVIFCYTAPNPQAPRAPQVAANTGRLIFLPALAPDDVPQPAKTNPQRIPDSWRPYWIHPTDPPQIIDR